jgi:hypothetical protein
MYAPKRVVTRNAGATNHGVSLGVLQLQVQRHLLVDSSEYLFQISNIKPTNSKFNRHLVLIRRNTPSASKPQRSTPLSLIILPFAERQHQRLLARPDAVLRNEASDSSDNDAHTLHIV